MGFYIKCPYYIDHKEKSITCEDTVRYYGTKERTFMMIKTYCEPGQECKHAKALDQLYERMERMEEKDKLIEQLRHECFCKGKEITKLKKEMTNLHNRKEIERQKTESRADLYKERAKKQDAATKMMRGAISSELAKSEAAVNDTKMVAEQQNRALEMMIGFLCHTHGVTSFRLADVREFGLKFETRCSVPDPEDDLITIELGATENE